MSAAALGEPPRLDHLVVLADTLDAGAAWCEARLGVAPGAGGEHPLFGTHNRLLNVSSAHFPHAYLELIAINSEARYEAEASAGGRKRWFDMDDGALREQVRAHGPRLIHWVARVPDVGAATTALAARDIDRGDVLAASRMTPHGLLQWRISVRPDGQRLMGGVLPTLIEWVGAHPAESLPASGVALQSLTLRHPQAGALQAALDAVGVGRVAVVSGAAPQLLARLATPRGEIELASATP